MSSGSRRADSAVEPTRSQNITDTWRSAFAARQRFVSFGGFKGGRIKVGDGAQDLTMLQQNTEVLEVLLGEIADDREVNSVIGEALGV
jgi:hypothetical protein